MPQVNLPLGVFGIFISALDPSLVGNPNEDPENQSQGVWYKTIPAQLLVNLTRFLQQYANSPNASQGGQYGANMLTGFDIVFSGPTGVGFTAGLFEVSYADGQQPNVKDAGTNASLVLQVRSQPTLPTPANGASIISYTLGFPPGTGYWLIGQNNNDTETHLEIEVSAAINLFGINLYFGNR